MPETVAALLARIDACGDTRFIQHVPTAYLTPAKLANFIRARGEEREKATVLGSRPYHLVIEPTNACNLACPLCPTGINAGNRKRGTIPTGAYRGLIDTISPFAIELYLQNWGEPTLLPNLPEMISYAAERGLWIHLSSNFSRRYPEGYLSRLITSGLAALQVDVDGLDQEVYSRYRRNGDLSLVLANLKTALSVRNRLSRKIPVIEAVMLAMRHNAHQLAEFPRFAETLGVDAHRISRIQIDPVTGRSWLPKDPAHIYESYRHHTRPAACHWPWSGMVVNWDGGVSVCCIVDDRRADFGNVFIDGLDAVWNKEAYQSARAAFDPQRVPLKSTICNFCKNDTHNPGLHRAGASFAIRLE